MCMCVQKLVCVRTCIYMHTNTKWVVDQGNYNLGLEVITSNFMLVYCTNEAVCMCAYLYILLNWINGVPQ